MTIDRRLYEKEFLIKIVALAFLFFATTDAFTQPKEWKTEKTKDGRVLVKSTISSRIDENRKSVQLIEFIATYMDSLNISMCIDVMKDIKTHKVFWGATSSEKIKTLSETEWIVYYYFDSPWPAPNYDYVAKMKYSFDSTARKATFSLSAIHTAYEKKDLKRMTYYNVAYVFKEIGMGKVELTTTSSASPVFNAPAWLVSSYFPNGPAGILKRIAKLAKLK